MKRIMTAILLGFTLFTLTTPAEARRYKHHRHHVTSYDSGTVIGGRPEGCPRKYCGCALSLKIFGRRVAGLDLAYEWVRRFPRTSPAPSMVAARSGHALQLLEHRGGSNWYVYDPNSGRGATRMHVRNIAGYAIVNPHASRYSNDTTSILSATSSSLN